MGIVRETKGYKIILIGRAAAIRDESGYIYVRRDETERLEYHTPSV